MSRGSLYELDSLLDVAEELEISDTAGSKEARAIGDEVGRMLSALRTALNRRQ